MFFSVTYRLNQSLSGRSARYFWVIVSRDGDQVAFQQTLQKSSDTLYSNVPKWRPDREPFRCHIEEVLPNGSRKRISNSIALRRT
ncbi:MAG: hypothetical protein IH991_04540 [Planctomycetes bacterium]|nr:hypothetical protein [Planctomycetota bacterium]